MKREISSSELSEKLQRDSKPLVLDVRRSADVAAAPERIATAEWHDPTRVEEWLGEIPKDRQVVVYCVYGRSISNAVVTTLQSHGVNACLLEGGIDAWKAAEEPVESMEPKAVRR